MDKKTLNKYLNEDWIEVLSEFVLSDKLDNIFSILKHEHHVLPEAHCVFRAFNCCNWNEIKCLILGQDPFYTIRDDGQIVANGLAFASGVEGYVPPSLRNILKEAGITRITYDLYDWAEQGVLLLNTALTVLQNRPNSHSRLWAPFTEFVLSTINNKKKGIIVMLWGSKARAYKSLLSNQIILEAGHPSPLNTLNTFTGCNHFNICNQYLKEQGKKEISW